ncbi:MAG: hypothetical protein JWO03_2519 [Bacteroidetes bacterium]|nr:hypothetical protein [Bacteroidota bacterium]
MKDLMKMAMIIAAITITMAACKKEVHTSGPTGTPASKAEFFSTGAPAVQRFTITAGRYSSITGAKGTRVQFDYSSLLNSAGAPVTSGSVTVELQEMLTGPQMILAGKTTTSGGHLLISGGQVYLHVTQNGSELFVNPADKPILTIPTSSQSQRMQLFVGSMVVPPSGTDSVIDWAPADTSVTVNPTYDSVSHSNAYSLPITDFRYINCDYFYSYNQPLTDVHITLPSQNRDTNSRVYLYFPSINSVTELTGYSSGTNTFDLTSNYFIPIGIQANVVVVSWVGTQYYYQILPITVTSNMQVTAAPVAETLSNIQAAIAAM